MKRSIVLKVVLFIVLIIGILGCIEKKNETQLNEKAIKEDLEKASLVLSFEQIKGQNIKQEEITENLNLLKSGINETTIAWSAEGLSFGAELNNDTGEIRRGQKDNSVKLIAKIEKKGFTTEKTYDLIILQNEESLIADIEEAKKLLKFENIKGTNIDENNIEYDLILIKKGLYDTNILWTIEGAKDNADIDKQTGKVTRGSKNVELKLIALVTKRGKESRKEFILTIKETLISLTPTKVLFTSKGETAQLKAEIIPLDYNQEVTWVSSNEKVAIVSVNGVVTGLTSGTAIITATSKIDGIKKAQCTISVNILLDEFVVVEKGITLSSNASKKLSNDLYVGKYEVTHKQYIEFLNDKGVSNDGSYNEQELIDIDDNDCAIDHNGDSFYFGGSSFVDNESCPVIEVTWWGAIYYCNWLSEKEGLSKAYNESTGEYIEAESLLEGYRLPLESEWEYCARGGSEGLATKFSGSNSIGDVAWYKGNSENKTHNIGTKQANELGIYDMSGNVWEWCQSGNIERSLRGGSWLGSEATCNVSYSTSLVQFHSDDRSGFRVVRSKF